MTMDNVVTFFQVCHATDQPLREQSQNAIAAKIEFKEANQERDAAHKNRTVSHTNNSSSTGNNKSEKRGCTENLCCYCKTDGYEGTWNSCSCHNF